MTKSPAELVSEVQTRCNTCGRHVDHPYRRHDAHGKVIEGCIDDSHTGHLYGESLRWHNRPAAKKLRAEAKARLREILKSGRRRG
jgi:predicted secreted Zn-dependent protease